MTVEKIYEIIDEMINGMIASATDLNKREWSQERHEAVQRLCFGGETLLELRKRITSEEFKELCK